ncbi:MAG: serine/threonine-protein kinase, partial [Acidobacteria bacterium]|nr:serine/threonine-protein kinase [Acidobacteriota bacterium]
MSPEAQQTLSHYRLIEKIGEGGMGIVWKAEDTILHRIVAIKVLPGNYARDEERRRMFLQEACLASSVSQAHIAQVHEFGHEGDVDFIVMEFVDGKPLRRILHGRPLPPDTVADLGLQIAQALSQAHRRGLLHRDLKPANILVTRDGDAKLVDFGLAILFASRDQQLSPDAPTGMAIQIPDTDFRTSPSGSVAGTLPYMSPEQIRGEDLDSRTDIFSLGVILYEMTTGQRPFIGVNRRDLVDEILQARPRPVHDLVPKVPIDLDKIIQKAISGRPADRYQTMDDLAVDLKRLGRELESGSSPSYQELGKSVQLFTRQRIMRMALAGLLAAAAIGLGTWGTMRYLAGRVDPRTILILPMQIRGQTEGADFRGIVFAEQIA